MKNKIIFSVYNGSVNDYTNHIEILKRLKSLSAKELQGKYKGSLELSIILDGSFFDAIKIIAKKFKQESILLVDEKGVGRLMYLNDSRLEKIGKFKQISKKEASKLDSWSRVNETYFTFGG